jgi:hypothetical protein
MIYRLLATYRKNPAPSELLPKREGRAAGVGMLGDTYLTTIEINFGSIVEPIQYDSRATLDYREPEGVSIQTPDLSQPSRARLCFGFSSEHSCVTTQIRHDSSTKILSSEDVYAMFL